MAEKPKLYVTRMSNQKFKVQMKGDGVLLYKSKQELDELISWNQYNIEYVEG